MRKPNRRKTADCRKSPRLLPDRLAQEPSDLSDWQKSIVPDADGFVPYDVAVRLWKKSRGEPSSAL